jgi:hypothetical protein
MVETGTAEDRGDATAGSVTRCERMDYLILLAAASAMTADPGSLASLKWERRALLVSAPASDDAELAVQRGILARWKPGGDARDLTVVEVVGDRVSGASNSAVALRRTYRLSPTRFTAILIGKDGGEKLRSGDPIPAAVLEGTIDAMPMRQSGGR